MLYLGNHFNSWSLIPCMRLRNFGCIFSLTAARQARPVLLPCNSNSYHRIADGPSRKCGRLKARTLTQQVLHDEHVVLPQVAEGSPAGLAVREGVALYPAATGKVVEVITGVNRLIQATHDHTGHCDAWLCEAQARMSCRKNNISFTSRSFHIPRQETWILGKHFCGCGWIIRRYFIISLFLAIWKMLLYRTAKINNLRGLFIPLLSTTGYATAKLKLGNNVLKRKSVTFV